jgi:hypothetical protein
MSGNVGRHTLLDLLGNRRTAAATGAVTTTDKMMAYIKQLVTNSELNAYPRCVEKTDGAFLNGSDSLFTISGGMIRCKIVGLVTTVLVGTGTGRLTFTSVAPAATINLNAGAVACDADAAGTIYYNVGATSVFTPSSSLGGMLLDPVTVEETEFLLAPGTIKFLGSAAQTGVIAWYLSYIPLSENVSVVAAA